MIYDKMAIQYMPTFGFLKTGQTLNQKFNLIKFQMTTSFNARHIYLKNFGSMCVFLI